MDFTVFRSASRSLRVSFPPEQFGMGEDVKGNLAPYPPVKFQEGVARVNSDKLLDLLRRHSGNEANGGSYFWEEKPEVTQSYSLKDGDVLIGVKDFVMTDSIKSKIDKVDGYTKKLIPPKIEDACKQASEIIDTLKIIGLKRPNPDLGVKRVQARLTELIGVLEDKGIIGGDDSNSNGDS